MGKARKCTKRGYHANLKKSPKEMLETKKPKSMIKTPQGPVVGSRDIQNVAGKNNNLDCKLIKEEINVLFEPEELDEFDFDDSDYDTKKSINGPGSDSPFETPSNEELWVVRKQLCRGCHSDGAFWSLETTTEGDTYGDLLQTYFNIELCPVSKDDLALSAICSLCAARVREARAFSAQAHAAEERFTRFYKENRVRVFIDEESIKKEAPEILDEVSDSEPITNAMLKSRKKKPTKTKLNAKVKKVKRERKKPLKKKKIEKIVEESTESRIDDDPELSTEELPGVPGDKPAPKKLLEQLPMADYERVGNSYKCHCGKLFANKRNILYHIKKQHSVIDEKNQTKEVKRSNIYKLSPSDFEVVGDSYKCTRCQKQFNDYTRMRYHVTYVHLKLPRYNCTHCEKSFNAITACNKHKFLEHSVDVRLKCDACDWFTYGTKSGLVEHMKNYHMLGERYNCSECDFVTYRARGIKKHAVKHSTVKEHHCKYCKKSFLRKNNLDFHERIHTGDKRKVCDVCGQAFVQRASLKYHMEKHHPEIH